jgi:hypothetical protein
LKIIETAFEGLPLEELSLADIPALYEEIDEWVSIILSGKIDELPNGQTPPAL